VYRLYPPGLFLFSKIPEGTPVENGTGAVSDICPCVSRKSYNPALCATQTSAQAENGHHPLLECMPPIS